MDKPYIIGFLVLLGIAIIMLKNPQSKPDNPDKKVLSPSVWKCLVNKSDRGVTYLCKRITGKENFTDLDPSIPLSGSWIPDEDPEVPRDQFSAHIPYPFDQAIVNNNFSPI